MSLVGCSDVAVASPPVAAAEVAHGAGSSGNAVTGNSCHGVFSGNPPGSLIETTSAGPDDSLVNPGQTITVTLHWHPSDFGGNTPSKTEACVEIGSQVSATLSQEHKPGPSGGSDTFSFLVPDGTGGQPICIRAAVAGPMASAEKSAILCYTVMGAATPEASMAILFPLAGLFIVGGAVLVARRRRARPHSPATPL